MPRTNLENIATYLLPSRTSSDDQIVISNQGCKSKVCDAFDDGHSGIVAADAAAVDRYDAIAALRRNLHKMRDGLSCGIVVRQNA